MSLWFFVHLYFSYFMLIRVTKLMTKSYDTYRKTRLDFIYILCWVLEFKSVFCYILEAQFTNSEWIRRIDAYIFVIQLPNFKYLFNNNLYIAIYQKNRSKICRMTVHGIYHVICSRHSFHEPEVDCICKYWRDSCANRYHIHTCQNALEACGELI